MRDELNQKVEVDKRRWSISPTRAGKELGVSRKIVLELFRDGHLEGFTRDNHTEIYHESIEDFKRRKALTRPPAEKKTEEVTTAGPANAVTSEPQTRNSRPEAVSLGEAAKRLGITHQEAFRLIREGKLEGYRLSKAPPVQWHVYLDSLQNFVDRPRAAIDANLDSLSLQNYADHSCAAKNAKSELELSQTPKSYSPVNEEGRIRRTVSVRKVAKTLGVSIGLIYRLLHRGELEGARIGRRRMVYVDGLKAYLERNALGPRGGEGQPPREKGTPLDFELGIEAGQRLNSVAPLNATEQFMSGFEAGRALATRRPTSKYYC